MRLKVSLEESHLVIAISSVMDMHRSREVDLRETALFACVAERVRALGGDATLQPLSDGGSLVSVQVPQEPLVEKDYPSVATR